MQNDEGAQGRRWLWVGVIVPLVAALVIALGAVFTGAGDKLFGDDGATPVAKPIESPSATPTVIVSPATPPPTQTPTHVETVTATPTPTPTPVPTPKPRVIARDDFETGNWVGGHGWLKEWEYYNAEIKPTAEPHQGSYHLRLHPPWLSGSVWAKRVTDLSAERDARLQFWARIHGLREGDYAECRVSPDGDTWYAVATWTSSDLQDRYEFVDVDLSSYEMAPTFWVKFSGALSSGASLYVDALAIVSS